MKNTKRHLTLPNQLKALWVSSACSESFLIFYSHEIWNTKPTETYSQKRVMLEPPNFLHKNDVASYVPSYLASCRRYWLKCEANKMTRGCQIILCTKFDIHLVALVLIISKTSSIPYKTCIIMSYRLQMYFANVPSTCKIPPLRMINNELFSWSLLTK